MQDSIKQLRLYSDPVVAALRADRSKERAQRSSNEKGIIRLSCYRPDFEYIHSSFAELARERTIDHHAFYSAGSRFIQAIFSKYIHSLFCSVLFARGPRILGLEQRLIA
jgi:hypothetical protein